MSKLLQLAELGQSVWYDYIQRCLIKSGDLSDLIRSGLRGVTSNPTIFEKAINGSTDYNTDLNNLVQVGHSVNEIYEALVKKDIILAVDLFRQVYDASKGLDGYVSLEVDPRLADKTQETIDEAKRLFAEIKRPNLMIKVPATKAGIPAITELIGSGINVNVTLIFSIKHYLDVTEAYLKGLEQLQKSGGDLSKVASVASFFVSRIDAAVDKQLEESGKKDLMGKTAIANAKVAYSEFQKIFSGSRWEKLHDDGAKVQRLLWASTGTKNPDFPDTLYIDELIGPYTVNTIPPATLDAFLDHGTVKETILKDTDAAKSHLTQLEKLGINLELITDQLQEKGVYSFSESFQKLMETINTKRELILKKEGLEINDEKNC